MGGSVEIIENVGLIGYITLLGLNEFHFQFNPTLHVNYYFLAPSYEIWEGGVIFLKHDKVVLEMVDLLVNIESEKIIIYVVKMVGPLQIVVKGEDNENEFETNNQNEKTKTDETENDKGR